MGGSLGRNKGGEEMVEGRVGVRMVMGWGGAQKVTFRSTCKRKATLLLCPPTAKHSKPN